MEASKSQQIFALQVECVNGAATLAGKMVGAAMELLVYDDVKSTVEDYTYRFGAIIGYNEKTSIRRWDQMEVPEAMIEQRNLLDDLIKRMNMMAGEFAKELCAHPTWKPEFNAALAPFCCAFVAMLGYYAERLAQIEGNSGPVTKH